jgi:enamine deaminase RidA (YjgF/YER057c/UK114 family)
VPALEPSHDQLGGSIVSIEERLKELGITVPGPRTPAGNYVLATVHGGLVYSSGQGSEGDGGERIVGQLGGGVDVTEGYRGARWCAINCLAAIRSVVGSLDRVDGIHFVRGFINSAPGFADQPAVLNGASDLLVEIFGPAGRHARAAIGVAALPKGFAVEIEVVARLRP